MGKLSFTKLEARLRKRKWPVFLADVNVEYNFINSNVKGNNYIKSIIRPKDLAELTYKLLGGRKGSVYGTPSLRVQCYNGAQRSIEDLFVIAINYIPDLTYSKLQEILHPLLNGVEKDGVVKGRLFNHHFCSTVKKQVHTPCNVGCSENKVRESLGKNNIIFK